MLGVLHPGYTLGGAMLGIPPCTMPGIPPCTMLGMYPTVYPGVYASHATLGTPSLPPTPPPTSAPLTDMPA